MSLESELYGRLSGFAGLTALVGTRIYPGILPPDVTYPAVSFRRVGGTPEHAMGADTELRRVQVQVDCWARDGDPKGTNAYDSALAIADQVLSALRRWSTASGTIVQDTYVTNEGLDVSDPDLLVQHRVLEFEIVYEG